GVRVVDLHRGRRAPDHRGIRLRVPHRLPHLLHLRHPHLQPHRLPFHHQIHTPSTAAASARPTALAPLLQGQAQAALRRAAGGGGHQLVGAHGRPTRPLHPGQAAARVPPPPQRCPPGGARCAVLYTTTLRAVRATFEACNAARAALQSHGVAFRERDVSMDRGFRDELRALLLPGAPAALPRLFVRGRHVGGAEEVLRLDEEGALAPLLEGLPRARSHGCCDGCGGMRFLPCFDCSGSRKVLSGVGAAVKGRPERGVVLRCRECNENGLVLCPICS
uniref:Glutaredoxin domain-containing protein n=1 Tax=Aegilops tauschii subsp. strangulata TaxID=200361 RepID=A0A452XZU7_AEGTS